MGFSLVLSCLSSSLLWAGDVRCFKEKQLLEDSFLACLLYRFPSGVTLVPGGSPRWLPSLHSLSLWIPVHDLRRSSHLTRAHVVADAGIHAHTCLTNRLLDDFDELRAYSRESPPNRYAVVFPLCGPDTRKAPSALPTPGDAGYPHSTPHTALSSSSSSYATHNTQQHDRKQRASIRRPRFRLPLPSALSS